MDGLYANFSHQSDDTTSPYDLSSTIGKPKSEHPFKAVLQHLLQEVQYELGLKQRNSAYGDYIITPTDLLR